MLVAMLMLATRALGSTAGSTHGLEPLLELVAVVLGLLVVAVSLHVLDEQDQGCANVLVVGILVAAICNFLHGVLAHSTPVHMPAEVAQPSLWLSTVARLGEAFALGWLAFGGRLPGRGRLWLVLGVVCGLLVVALAQTPLAAWLSTGLQGHVRTVVASGLALLLGMTAWRLFHRPDQAASGPGLTRNASLAAAAFAFMAGELAVATLGGHSAIGGPLAHALRVVGYALLFQEVFTAGIRQPYHRLQDAQERLRENETRLTLLGRNLPHTVLYQIVREPDGTRQFVHVSDAVERVHGVTAQAVMQDARLLYGQIVEEDRAELSRIEIESFRTLTPMEAVVRTRHPGDGQQRWMRISASPRRIGSGRMLWDGVISDVTAEHHAQEAEHALQAQMANMLQRMPGGVARIDRDLRVLYVNPQQAQWMKTTPDQIRGRFLAEVLPWDLHERLLPRWMQAFAGQPAVFENRIDGRNGPRYWHSAIVPEAPGPDGVSAVTMFSYDLTGLKRIEQELEQQKARLASVVNAMPDMVFLKDVEGVYLAVNPVFERFAGRPESDIVGRRDEDLFGQEQAEQFRRYDHKAMAAWQPLAYEETLRFAEDGYEGLFETIKTPIRDLSGQVTGVLGVCRDITDRKRAEQEIERLAFFDALTGLPNRRLLLDRLQHAVMTSQRSRQLGALLFIDLDNFKDLNDTLGHDMGDQLLRQVAQRLSGCVREVDTVARFGGDEFVVMLENLSAEL
ncbi:PAS domain-containing protein, partial [Acidovorax lacteus]